MLTYLLLQVFSIRNSPINDEKCSLAPLVGFVPKSDIVPLLKISITFTTKVVGVKGVTVWLSLNLI